MKLLIIGSDNSYSIENIYVKYLRDLGIDVIQYAAQNKFHSYYYRSFLNKLLYRLGISGILNEINTEIVSTINKTKPDCVWIFKGMEVFPSTLNEIKKMGIKTVNYNPDNPFIFSGKGSGNSNVTKSISLYDLYLTYNSEVKREIEQAYNMPAMILPFGFDISNELYDQCSLQQEVIKLCFLGNPDKYRSEFLMQLAERGIKLDVYGYNWDKFLRHSNINIMQPVLNDNFWLTLRKYRVQLNLNRVHTQDSHNMRSFEIPGVGGIQLAPNTPDHQKYFDVGKEIFLFDGINECVLQIKKLIALTTDETNTIRNHARERSLKSGYSYRDRSQLALQYINSLYE